MTSTPIVSVIVPCFEQAHFLPEAIASLQAQTRDDWEAIVVHDDPASAEAAEALSKSDSRVRAMAGRNRGLADARNVAIESANGAFILPLDADDMIAPTFLERALAAVDRARDYSIVTASMKMFGRKSTVLAPPPHSPKHLLDENTFFVASLFQKKLWEQTPLGYDPAMILGPEDWCYWIECGRHDPAVIRIADPLFHYRIHPNNGLPKNAPHRAFALACMYLIHADLYGPLRASAACSLLARMPDSALTRIEHQIALCPKSAALRFFHGLALEGRGRFDEAIVEYAFAAGPATPSARFAEYAKQRYDRLA